MNTDSSVPAPVPSPVPSIGELLGHADWARRLARDLTTDEGRAEDAVQDAYVAALERPPDRSENLRGWFARVVANGIRMRGRTESRRLRRERASARDEALPSAAELAGEIEWQRRIASVVLELDEPQRTTVVLHFYRQLPLAEIARRQDEPAATVRSRLKRALDQLRARFDREYGGDRRAWCALLSTWARRGAGAAAPTISTASTALWLGIAVLAGGGAWTVWKSTRDAAPGSKLDALAALTPSASAVPSHPEERDVGPGEDSREGFSPEEPRSRMAAGTPAAATGPAFSGTVADRAGNPIAGARITAHVEENRPFSDAIGTGESGPDGRFSFASPPAEPPGLTLVVRAAGFSTLVAGHATPDRDLAVVLDRVSVVTGTVRDAETHAALAGVALSSGLERTVSDERGRYRLEGLPPDPQASIRARAAGYAVDQREVVLKGSEHSTLDFDLVRGVHVDVEVLDAGTETPLANVAVRDSGDDVPWTRTDAKGRFVLSVAPEHAVELELAREGFLQPVWNWTPGSVENGKTVRVPMVRMVSVEGRVVDDLGDAIPDTWLSAQGPSGAFRMPAPTAEVMKRWDTPGSLLYRSHYLEEGVRSRADGRYALPIRSGMPTFTVHAGRPGYVSARHGPIDASSPSPETTVDFVLARAAKIHGQALRDGKPWQGRVIFHDGTGQEVDGAWVAGEYRLENVPAGTWTIALEDRTRKTKDPALPSFSIRVEAGGTYEHDFVWGEDAPSGTISGRVVASSGVLPGKLYATARPVEEPDQAGDSTDVESDGTFTLRVPAGKPYLVSAWVQDSERQHTDETKVVPDIEGVVLRMPELGKVRLRLVDSTTGEPLQPRSHFLANALAWRPAGSGTEGGWENVQIDRDGCFEFELRVGDYDLRLDLAEEGYRPLACEATPVRAGESTVRTLELVRGVEVRVRIVGPSSEEVLPLAGHLLFLVEQGQIASISGPYPNEDARGRHRFGGINGLRMRIDDPSLMQQLLSSDDVFRDGVVLKALAPGRYSVRCFPEDYVFEPAELDVNGPGRTTLEFRWRKP